MLEIEEAIKDDIESIIEEMKELAMEPSKEIQVRYNDVSIEVGATLLNMCCMYSTIKKHDIALRFAMRAILILEQIFKSEVQDIVPFELQEGGEMSPQQARLIQTISSSYHNAAAEMEHLG